MKRNAWICVMVAVVLLFAGFAHAQKPGRDVNPNGFPSGEHFNLNIIGKKPNFACPEPELDPATGLSVYGNVVFVPANGEGIQIHMQSGKGAKAAAIPTLQAIDPCTSAFDGDPAVIQLPKNDLGYRVYARALATPTDNPSMIITPDLVAVEDEFGNDLMYLGLVTSNGFVTPSVEFTRVKGKSTAIPITGLFQWTGSVCYLFPGYCDGVVPACTPRSLCCTDTDLDGVFDDCTVLSEGESCSEGSVPITALCRDYTETWVFNIGDFVTYLWGLDNQGLKLLQVRFYPVK